MNTNNNSNSNNNNNNRKIIGGYTVQKKLGSGSFATVYLGVKSKYPPSTSSNSTHPPNHNQNHNNSNSNSNSNEEAIILDQIAIKAISRRGKKLTPKLLENLDLEIQILKTYRHPHIVSLQNVIQTEQHFYLLLEYCGGGDVQQLIKSRKHKKLSEGLTRRLMRDLTSGLCFLWNQNVMHRDIKPQNLLLTGLLPLDERHDVCLLEKDELMRQKVNFPSHQFQLKIADFGFARPLETASLAETLCGSPLYMAPEILEGQK